MQVNIYEAKTKLSLLIARVAAGEEVVIAKAGTPVARLVPFGERPARRKLGSLAGRVRLSEDFEWSDEELDELADR